MKIYITIGNGNALIEFEDARYANLAGDITSEITVDMPEECEPIMRSFIDTKQLINQLPGNNGDAACTLEIFAGLIFEIGRNWAVDQEGSLSIKTNHQEIRDDNVCMNFPLPRVS